MGMSLQGKSAIVTGAGAGINLEFAKKLLEAGVNVLIADLALTSPAEEMVKQYTEKPKAVFEKTDVASWADLEKMFKVAQEHFGSIDIVCPGAGVFEPAWSSFWVPPGSGPSQDTTDSSRYKLMDINLTHPIRTAQMAISHFLASTPPPGPTNPKCIVFIASIAGEISFLATPLYHASKFGVIGLIHSLAPLDEYFGIKVCGVAPGIVKTDIWFREEGKIAIVTDKATGKIQEDWVTPQEVAEAMVALVKDSEVDDGKGGKIPIKSGTVLEVASKSLRDVPMLGNTGPAIGSPGLVLSNMESAYVSILGELQKPGWGKF